MSARPVDAIKKNPMLVRWLKGIQIAVATSTTLILGAGLLWPGAMGLLMAPLGLLYTIWAIRAAFDHKFSIWLSFGSTMLVAVFLGAFALSMATSTFRNHDPGDRAIRLVAGDPAGYLIQLTPEHFPQLENVQARIDFKNRIHISILLLVALGAWLVTGLYVLEWKWAFARKGTQ